MERPRQHFTYSNVMSTLAVFLAVAGGGIAVAAVGRGDIGSREIDNNSLKSGDLKNAKGVKGKDVVDGSLGSADVLDRSLGGADVADDGLTGTDVDESSLGQVPSAASADSATSAGNADTLDGKHASDLQTSSAFAQRTDDLQLTGDAQEYVSTSITTTGTRVIALATAEVEGNGGGDDAAICLLRIAGTDSNSFRHDIAETPADEATMSLSFAAVVAPGTHSVALRCTEAFATDTGIDEANLTVWAVGS